MTEEVKGESLFSRIVPLPLVEEIKQSYLSYAMSVIVGRALPDARDGLKPVQRRILYSMMDLGLRHNSAFKKSATVVGSTMGKYHPHGDSAIYETMVRMAQPWSLRYCLVEGQGNFGSIDGDSAAAMRYTEARFFELGELMLADIEEDTVNWGPNFDESLQEPLTLPSAFPNLLVNGCTGIAVGMATNIPPHNLREVVDALCYILDTPEDEVEFSEILQRLPGPDFPTGGIILGREGIRDAYRTGRGRVIVRGCMHVEEGKRGRVSVVVTEIPFMLNKTTLIETMVAAAQEKYVDGVADIRDESDREGMRIVLDLTRDGDPDLVMRQLYKRTQLQSTFGVINLALDNGYPREMPIIDMLTLFLSHRRDVVRRRTQFRLNKALAREDILEGLLKALNRIEKVITLVRGAKSATEAKEGLMERFGFSELQTQAILEMRLQRLTDLEREKLQEELRQLLINIEEYRHILGDSKVLDGVVRTELTDIVARFGDDRRTEILDSYEEAMEEDLIPENDIVVVLSKDGFLRRQDLESYVLQGRGGKGRKGAFVHEEDAIAAVSVTHTHREIYFFTTKGRVLILRGHIVPETKTGKGKQISKLLPLEPNEHVVTLYGGELEGVNYAFFITRGGVAKRIELSELADSNRPRRVITLNDGDEIAQVRLTTGRDDLLLMTAEAQALRVAEEEFRAMGRDARGVRAMHLAPGDIIISCDVVSEESHILILSERGMGKRSRFGEFTLHHRGTSGVRAMNLGAKTGKLVGCWAVREQDEILAITTRGRMIRVAVQETPLLSRTAMGNITVRLDEGDLVADCSIVRLEEIPSESPGSQSIQSIQSIKESPQQTFSSDKKSDEKAEESVAKGESDS
ncbi:MAG: DNA gyrase subunit A [Synergistaceae bacterium]|jgi:DNA gyrase subunit A|nr:DNA gyrase subunit A [Synergistaceae bacterium]